MTSERLTCEALDPFLEPFLDAPTGSAAEHDALRVLIDQVTPVIEGVIRGRVFAAVAADEREELDQLVRERMERAVHLDVPLVVDRGWGASWGEAH